MRIAIFYATREGQTARIAEHVAGELRPKGILADVVNVAELARPVSLDEYTGVVLAASVHLGQHEREMVQFVKQHRQLLEKLPTAFLSVSMSEAGVEQPGRAPAERERARRDVRVAIESFYKTTGWRARHTLPVAGALLYRKYNWLVRLVMKWISQREGGPTDTSRNYEMTDWKALDHFVGSFLAGLPASA
jgi:menaquinone-dependent protoporphyrinogen oxidase